MRTKTRCYRLSAERTARPRARSRGPARPARWHSASRASKQSVNSKTFGRKRNPGTLSNTSQILRVRLPIATIQPPVVLATLAKIRWPWRLSQQRAETLRRTILVPNPAARHEKVKATPPNQKTAQRGQLQQRPNHGHSEPSCEARERKSDPAWIKAPVQTSYRDNL